MDSNVVKGWDRRFAINQIDNKRKWRNQHLQQRQQKIALMDELGEITSIVDNMINLLRNENELFPVDRRRPPAVPDPSR